MITQRLIYCCMVILFSTCVCYAQSSEELTITTYYPSPYGSYDELSTNYLNYGTAPSDMPTNGGVCTKEGQTAYSTTDKTVYLCDGANWKTIGGSYSFGGIYMQCDSGACRWPNPVTGECNCPAGYTSFRLWDWVTPGNPHNFYTYGGSTGSVDCGQEVSMYQCTK